MSGIVPLAGLHQHVAVASSGPTLFTHFMIQNTATIVLHSFAEMLTGKELFLVCLL